MYIEWDQDVYKLILMFEKVWLVQGKFEIVCFSGFTNESVQWFGSEGRGYSYRIPYSQRRTRQINPLPTTCGLPLGERHILLLWNPSFHCNVWFHLYCGFKGTLVYYNNKIKAFLHFITKAPFETFTECQTNISWRYSYKSLRHIHDSDSASSAGCHDHGKALWAVEVEESWYLLHQYKIHQRIGLVGLHMLR